MEVLYVCVLKNLHDNYTIICFVFIPLVTKLEFTHIINGYVYVYVCVCEDGNIMKLSCVCELRFKILIVHRLIYVVTSVYMIFDPCLTIKRTYFEP